MPKEGQKVNLELIDFKVTSLKEDIEAIKRSVSGMNGTLVTKTEFDLRVGRIEQLVYGLVGLILTGVVGAIVSLVVKK